MRSLRFRLFVFLSFVLLGAVFAASRAEALTPAQQAGLDLGMDRNYAIIALGNGNTPTFSWNSGPVAGNVLMGQGEKASFSGGGNGGLTSGHVLYYDSTVTGTNTFNSLQTHPTTSQVSTSLTQNAATIATNVSNYAASLSPTQTFSDITNTTTITGDGGLNVIDFANLHDAKLTLSGTANDYFIFNISGQIHTNQPMTLSGSVDPSHILFNLTGTGMVLFQTAGGDISYGTYLATNGGSFQFSNLNLTGALINIGGDVAFVSGSTIPNSPPFTVPETSTSIMLLLGAAVGGGVMLRRRRASASN
jgi:hypothetical protein